MKKAIQLILLAWFLTVNLFILIPSFYLLRGSSDETTKPPTPPAPPAAMAIGPLDPSLDLEKQKQQLEVYKLQVGHYAEQVKTYTQQVAAAKSYQEAMPSSKRSAVYELVVKNTLITLISGFATALIAYVFTSLGANVVDNFVRMRNNEAPQPLSLL
jgi:hypothetical protein